MSHFLTELEDRLFRYVKIDTTADPASTTSPSSQIQFDLLNLLACELKEMGAENDMQPVELAREACRKAGVEPFSVPIRGGTDGSRLTEMGVPTPNLLTGMQEIHGPLEWVSLAGHGDGGRNRRRTGATLGRRRPARSAGETRAGIPGGDGICGRSDRRNLEPAPHKTLPL
jgi:hypothetical protein